MIESSGNPFTHSGKLSSGLRGQPGHVGVVERSGPGPACAAWPRCATSVRCPKSARFALSQGLSALGEEVSLGGVLSRRRQRECPKESAGQRSPARLAGSGGLQVGSVPRSLAHNLVRKQGVAKVERGKTKHTLKGKMNGSQATEQLRIAYTSNARTTPHSARLCTEQPEPRERKGSGVKKCEQRPRIGQLIKNLLQNEFPERLT